MMVDRNDANDVDALLQLVAVDLLQSLAQIDAAIAAPTLPLEPQRLAMATARVFVQHSLARVERARSIRRDAGLASDDVERAAVHCAVVRDHLREALLDVEQLAGDPHHDYDHDRCREQLRAIRRRVVRARDEQPKESDR